MNKLMQKLKTTPQGWETKPKERRSYYLYFLGQNAIYNLVSTFLTTYLMFSFASEEKAGIDPLALTSGIVLAVKIWDAVNDAIFGVIFDKVRFKSGKKFLPWLKVSLVFIPLTTVLLFAIPKSLSTNVKLAWLAIAYILWDTAYTLCDVPIFGVITAMTENLNERNAVLSYKSIWGGIGSGIAIVLASILVGEKIKLNYTIVAICCAVVAFFTMAPACSRLEERYVGEQEEDFTLKKMFSYLIHNKYLLIYYLGYFFYSGANVANALNLFASFYLFNNSQLSLVVQAVGIVPSLIMSLLVPSLIKKYDKMKIFRFCTLLSVALSIVIYFVGYSNFIVFAILYGIRSVPVSIVGVMLFLFTPDCAEYGLYTTGINAKGITFSIQTFMVKLTSAVSSSLPLLILGLFGWVSVNVENFDELAASGVTQTPTAINALWFLYIMLPAIGWAIAWVIWKFYKLTDVQVQEMALANAKKLKTSSKSSKEKAKNNASKSNAKPADKKVAGTSGDKKSTAVKANKSKSTSKEKSKK